jgi:hypothetical protein
MKTESAAILAFAAGVLLFSKTQVGFAADDRGVGDIYNVFKYVNKLPFRLPAPCFAAWVPDGVELQIKMARGARIDCRQGPLPYPVRHFVAVPAGSRFCRYRRDRIRQFRATERRNW